MIIDAENEKNGGLDSTLMENKYTDSTATISVLLLFTYLFS